MTEVRFKTGEQRDMAQRMLDATTVYLEKLDDIKTKMVDMGHYWIDPQYEAFMGVFDEEYRKLEALREDLNSQIDTVKIAADAGDTTTQTINRIISS